MQVVLKRYEDKALLPVQVDKIDATVGDLKEVIADQLHIHYDAQRLIYPSRELGDSSRLSELQLQDDHYVYLLVRDLESTSKFHVKMKDASQRFTFRLHPWLRMSSLFEKISELAQVPVSQLQLFDFRGHEIDVRNQSDRISKVLTLANKYRLYYKVIDDGADDSLSSLFATVDESEENERPLELCDLFT
jgi:hypothetical protein